MYTDPDDHPRSYEAEYADEAVQVALTYAQARSLVYAGRAALRRDKDDPATSVLAAAVREIDAATSRSPSG